MITPLVTLPALRALASGVLSVLWSLFFGGSHEKQASLQCKLTKIYNLMNAKNHYLVTLPPDPCLPCFPEHPAYLPYPILLLFFLHDRSRNSSILSTYLLSSFHITPPHFLPPLTC